MDKFSRYDLQTFAIKVGIAKRCRTQIDFFKGLVDLPYINKEMCQQEIAKQTEKINELTGNRDVYLKAIATLPEDLRNVFMLRYIADAEVAQIAQKLGMKIYDVLRALEQGENMLIEAGFMCSAKEKANEQNNDRTG